MSVPPRHDQKVDVPNAARGASVGFTILVLGGLASPALGFVAPLAGSLALMVTAVAAFAVAGMKVGSAGNPPLQGAMTALGSYVLVLPLVLFHQAGRDPMQVAVTAACALVIGAATGVVASRLRKR